MSITIGLEAIRLAEPVCSVCATPFTRTRKDKRYCSKKCARVASRNAKRGPRLIADSAAAKRIHESRKGRVRGLSDALYETPPTYRAEYLQRLIAMARRNAELRRLVTNREMLRSWMRDEGTGRLHIAHVLDHYCREVYGQRSFEVVNPATELPGSDELVFPAEYFGPDAPPIYKDGGLNVRPCPWKARKAETAKSPSTTIKRT